MIIQLKKLFSFSSACVEWFSGLGKDCVFNYISLAEAFSGLISIHVKRFASHQDRKEGKKEQTSKDRYLMEGDGIRNMGSEEP